MSADLLREAAALMRSDAETELILRDGDPYYVPDVAPDGSLLTEQSRYEQGWHPAVALAVADWLDAEIDRLDAHLGKMVASFGALSGPDFALDPKPQALALARAYLGRDS